MHRPQGLRLAGALGHEVGAEAAVDAAMRSLSPSAFGHGVEDQVGAQPAASRALLLDDLQRGNMPGAAELEHLDGSQADGAGAGHDHVVAHAQGGLADGPQRRRDGVGEDGVLEGDVIRDGIEHLPGVPHQHVLGHAAVAA